MLKYSGSYANTENNFVLLNLDEEQCIKDEKLYSLLCVVQNIFRVVTNKVYSPMALALAQYFLNPIYIIFTLIVEKDFESKRGRRTC